MTMMNLIKTELYINNLKDLSKEELLQYMTEYCYSSFAEDIEYTEEEIDNGFFVTELESIRNSVFS
jgi:hypothetical protein